MYGGMAWGFAQAGDSEAIELGLNSLVARIFPRVVGVDTEYARSSSTTRQIHLFAKP